MLPPHDLPLLRFYGFDDTVLAVSLHEPDLRERVPERLVQDLWRTLTFDFQKLRTTSGEPVAIRTPGTLNHDSGPDFREARLRIGATEWVGDVEVHVTSHDWLAHRHHEDPRYNSTILHVTLQSDVWTGQLCRADGSILPEVVLQPLLTTRLRSLLHTFLTRPADVLPCADRWQTVPESIRTGWVQRLAQERLAARQAYLHDRFLTTPDAETLLYEALFTGLGYAKNAVPMATLTQRVPLSTLRSLATATDREALLLGTAGLLPAPSGSAHEHTAAGKHVADLRARYEALQTRYPIPPMPRTAWQFFRLRPANFPPLRIAQGTCWLNPGGLLYREPFRTLTEALGTARPLAALRRSLAAEPGGFWATHVRLERPCAPHSPALGKRRIDTLILNAVIPALLLHADQTGQPALAEAVTELLEALPPENDEITRRFRALGFPLRNARAAQGLHQLYRTRCTEGRCLSCAIGRHLLGR